MSDKVRKAFLNLIKGKQAVSSFTGTVVAIDEQNYTVDIQPSDGGPVYYDVRLKAKVEPGDIGFIIVPVKGTDVIVTVLGNDENYCYVAMVTHIDKIVIVTDHNQSLEFMKNGTIVFNGGTHNGLVKINDLKTELQRLHANTITLKNATAAAISTLSAALDGGVTATAFNTAIAAITNLNVTTLENTKVKHG